jgi:hypothetical protein
MVFRRVTVGTKVIPLLSFNPKRVGVVIFNNGSVNVYLHDSAQKVKEEGLVLTPQATITFLKAWGDPTEFEMWCVADAEDQDVRVYESFG